MLYGQIKLKNYLTDSSISFCAIGDTAKDKVPLQVSTFNQGIAIDKVLPKIFLEGGGGNNQKESYEFAAYFYNNHCELSQAVMPFMFITGDEGFYPEIVSKYIKQFIGKDIKEKKINSLEVFKKTAKKFNVFLIKKEYSDPDDEKEIYDQWVNAVGKERILNIKKPKSCVDIILGAIAITSGARNLESYVKDLRERDQNEERITEVMDALKLYDDKLANKEIRIVYNRLNEIKEEAIKLINQSEDKEKTKYYEDLKVLKRSVKNVSEKFICPIMNEIFLDPVTAADGNDYERKAFEVWLLKNKTSPIDDSVTLENTNTKNNVSLRKEIQAFNENPKIYAKKDKDSSFIIY